MNPNQALQRIRQQVLTVERHDNKGDLVTLASEIRVLDEWLTQGGGMPWAWFHPPAFDGECVDARVKPVLGDEHVVVVEGIEGVTEVARCTRGARLDQLAEAERIAGMLRLVPLRAVTDGLDIKSFAADVVTMIRTGDALARVRRQRVP